MSVSSIYDYYPSKEDLAYEIPIRRLAQFYAEFLLQAPSLGIVRERLHLFLSDGHRLCATQSRLGAAALLGDWPSVLIEEARVRRAVDDFGRIASWRWFAKAADSASGLANSILTRRPS
jgi:AcrR family transcriptional regulator